MLTSNGTSKEMSVLAVPLVHQSDEILKPKSSPMTDPCIHEELIFMVDEGKYTIIDPMGHRTEEALLVFSLAQHGNCWKLHGLDVFFFGLRFAWTE